jgi:ornithine cyclodeaminase
MSKKWELLYLSQEDCVAAGGTDMTGAMKAVERSFFLHGKGDFIQPGKPVIRWGGPETEETIGRIMSMPSWLGGEQYKEELQKRDLLGPINTAGIKFIPSRPWNPSKYGLPRGTGLIIIVDPETLIPACVMDAAIVSAMRTGAASGVAAKYLANPDSKIYGLVGASVQGHTQIMAMKKAVPSLEICKVYDLNRKTSEKFAENMANCSQMKISIVDGPEEVFRDADVVSTITMASSSYVKPEWYKEGVFHAESSFWDTPPEALRKMDVIVVDDWYQVKHHGVDVSWRAVRDGLIDESRITGNLGEVVVGKKKGRTGKKQRTFFNPIGLGIHDLSEAFRVFQNAQKMGIGKRLTLFEDPDTWLKKIR